MDCRETKEKLRKLAEGLLVPDEELTLREHLKKCPNCARYALAEQLLMSDFNQISLMQVSHPITINQVREDIAIRERKRKNTKLGVRIMRQIDDAVHCKPRLSLAVVGLFILLLASVLVPLKTGTPIGYEVTFAAPVSNLTLNQTNATKMLSALNINNALIEVSESESEPEYKITQLNDPDQVRKLIAVLESFGGKRIRSTSIKAEPEDRTIWKFILNESKSGSQSSLKSILNNENDSTFSINLKDKFKGDFTLWMPIGDVSDDSLHGILLDRQGEKTNIQILGETFDKKLDDCGWDQNLYNSDLNTQTPNGEWATFHMYKIEDVRKLEKMGFNFQTMKFETPRQVPIPGMGPKLNDISSNPFSDNAVIEFMIPQAYEVKVLILDENDREIRILKNCMPIAGIHQVIWDRKDADGNPVNSGIYLCRFVAGDYMETRKIEVTH